MESYKARLVKAERRVVAVGLGIGSWRKVYGRNMAGDGQRVQLPVTRRAGPGELMHGVAFLLNNAFPISGSCREGRS